MLANLIVLFVVIAVLGIILLPSHGAAFAVLAFMTWVVLFFAPGEKNP